CRQMGCTTVIGRSSDLSYGIVFTLYVTRRNVSKQHALTPALSQRERENCVRTRLFPNQQLIARRASPRREPVALYIRFPKGERPRQQQHHLRLRPKPGSCARLPVSPRPRLKPTAPAPPGQARHVLQLHDRFPYAVPRRPTPADRRDRCRAARHTTRWSIRPA